MFDVTHHRTSECEATQLASSWWPLAPATRDRAGIEYGRVLAINVEMRFLVLTHPLRLKQFEAREQIGNSAGSRAAAIPLAAKSEAFLSGVAYATPAQMSHQRLREV